jgi:hypothetical protein
MLGSVWNASQLAAAEATDWIEPRLNGPARRMNPGVDARIINPGPHTERGIAERAVEWRFRVEEDGRIGRAEEKRRERALEARRRTRQMAWAADWAEYQVVHAGELLPKILDLTEQIGGNDALLHVVLEPQEAGDLCKVCWGPLDSPAYGETEPLLRAMPCNHALHRTCLCTSLTRNNRACPVCFSPETGLTDLVLKSSNDDPKSRWDEDSKSWFQVDGYISFLTGHEGQNFFEPYGNENRWGDPR